MVDRVSESGLEDFEKRKIKPNYKDKEGDKPSTIKIPINDINDMRDINTTNPKVKKINNEEVKECSECGVLFGKESAYITTTGFICRKCYLKKRHS